MYGVMTSYVKTFLRAIPNQSQSCQLIFGWVLYHRIRIMWNGLIEILGAMNSESFRLFAAWDPGSFGPFHLFKGQ